MTITVLKNGSPGAPATFTGAAGSLRAVLDYCLAAAGWTKVYTGTNLSTYRAPAGNRFYLALDDTAATRARVRAFESVAAAGVAVTAASLGPMPSDTQAAGGGYLYKSADTSTARSWLFVGSDTSFHLMWNTNATTYNAMFFGDFISLKAGDAYNVALFCDIGSAGTGLLYPACVASVSAVDQTGHYAARNHVGIGGSAGVNLAVNAVLAAGGTGLGKGGVAYPSPLEGAMLLSPVYLLEPSVGLRGIVPGLWSPLHQRPLANDTVFAGAGAWSGKTFTVRWLEGTGCAAYETSDTWGT